MKDGVRGEGGDGGHTFADIVTCAVFVRARVLEGDAVTIATRLSLSLSLDANNPVLSYALIRACVGIVA